MHPTNSPLSLLAERRSTPSRQLAPPGPTAVELEAMLGYARRVPDHGKLAPWRVITIRDAAVPAFAHWLANHQEQTDPSLAQAVREKDRQRYAHACCVLVVVLCPHQGHKIPVREQLLSAGCVAFSLLLAAQGMGFGGQWLTGWAAYDRVVADKLGLAAHEEVVGFIHLGRPTVEAPERLRPDVADKLSDWTID